MLQTISCILDENPNVITQRTVYIGYDNPVDDADVFYHYDTFDELLHNCAIGFKVLEVNGTCLSEFDLSKGE